MLINLKDLGNPLEFWEYFDQISKIPRCSGNEEKICNFISHEAEKFGFETKKDDRNNLVVKINSKNKGNNNTKIVLQCHLDMVCEKNEGTIHDFSKDPISLRIIEINDEKWLSTKGTTLGADNGVGIAYLLTLMKKVHSNELVFDSRDLNLLFTVQEEKGLSGAFNIGKDFISGDYLINLDSEDDDSFIIGCAGGINTNIDIHFIESNINSLLKNPLALKLFVKGLVGGHSGADIHRNRANAIKIISEVLWKLNDKYSLHLNAINGGNLSNAIPRECEAIFFIKKNEISDIKRFFNQIFSEIKVEFSETEPNIELTLNIINDFKNTQIMPINLKEKLLHTLYIIPHGPISYHSKIPNLVHTSTNLASIKTENNLIKIKTSQRSLQEEFKKEICQKIHDLFMLSGLKATVHGTGGYPGWEPDFNSKLVEISKKAYKKLFKEEPKIEVIHAGLETGILRKTFPKLDMISIGPTIKNPHSPDERLKIKSVEKMWNFLITLLMCLI